MGRRQRGIRGLFGSLTAFKQPKYTDGIRPVEDFQKILVGERARADRNSRHFCLAAFRIKSSEETSKTISDFLDLLTERVRLSDITGWLSDGQIGVLLPETTQAGSLQLAEDIRLKAASKNLTVAYSIHTYPQDGSSDYDDSGNQLYFWNISPDAEKQADIFSFEAKKPTKAKTKSHIKSGAELSGNKQKPELLEEVIFKPFALWKRALDIIISIIILLVLSPLLLLISVVIKCVSPGPIFFRQKRLGYRGREFMIFKFRTMHVNKSKIKHKHYVTSLVHSNEPMTKIDGEMPVIFLGKVLRYMALDELPQLFNVLQGDMSIVGPRPPIPYEVQEYEPWHRGRFDCLPGMTGLWQVKGKNRLTFREMVSLDIQYSRKKSLWLDIKIMLMTPKAIADQVRDAFAAKRLKVGG